jgi:asparagine synthase (glutamine-hydrolysing)
MSGIVGLFHRSGESAGLMPVERMIDAVRHRGPDRQAALCAGPAGLGHAMLWTTPESINEVLPYRQKQSGLVITADARIDNRDELIRELGMEIPGRDISDSEIILRAYEKWGNDCPTKLIGDFAFAIWNERRQEFFCSRDPMGIKCVYYFVSPTLFAFGTEIKAICALPGVPVRLNETRVLDYLANLFDDREITFYEDIRRLPAASSVVVDRQSVKLSRYWNLDPQKELKLRSDGEYTEAFKACFSECVRARLRSAYPVGSALSGGLDSSGIACAGRQMLPPSQPMHTFSLIFPSLPPELLKLIDERSYIDDVLKLGGFEPHFIRADELSPMKDVEKVHRHLDEAYFESNLYLHWAMYETANRHGVRIFLDGLDGDTTISHGYEYLADLVVGLRFPTIWREQRLLSERLGIPGRRIVREFCIKPFCPTWVYTAWRRLHGRPDGGYLMPTLLSEPFKERLQYEARMKSMVVTSRSCMRTAREKHWEMMNFALYAHALEVADKASAAFSVEARYPFFDRRILELCLSLPASQKLSHGWSRLILRRAMSGVLPESVQWRVTKANLSPNFYTRLLDGDRQVLEDVILTDGATIEPYVDLAALRRAYDEYGANPLKRHDDSVNVFAAVNLAIWLRTTGLTPADSKCLKSNTSDILHTV